MAAAGERTVQSVVELFPSLPAATTAKIPSSYRSFRFLAVLVAPVHVGSSVVLPKDMFVTSIAGVWVSALSIAAMNPPFVSKNPKKCVSASVATPLRASHAGPEKSQGSPATIPNTLEACPDSLASGNVLGNKHVVLPPDVVHTVRERIRDGADGPSKNPKCSSLGASACVPGSGASNSPRINSFPFIP